MDFLDAFWHVLNLFAPALGVGLIAAAAAKLLWRKALAQASYLRLVLWTFSAGAAVLLAGLVVLGQDGRMLTYGAMVLACATALWWAGFRRAR